MTKSNVAKRRDQSELSDPQRTRSAMQQHHIQPQRRLGQNFLVDAEILHVIVETLQLTDKDSVLEIGTGLGTLSVVLAQQAGILVGIEIDPQCVQATRHALRSFANARVVEGNALTVVPAELGFDDEYLVAGNIPYNLTGLILEHFLSLVPPAKRLVLLVQREVAMRLSASAGDWSLATVAVRSLATVERVCDVPPEAFDPPPAVHSSLLRLTPRPLWTQIERATVLVLARAAFQKRRKMLRHGMTWALHGDEPAALNLLSAAGIDSTRRPGTLTLDEWQRLAQVKLMAKPKPTIN